jgi:hypothetical protein
MHELESSDLPSHLHLTRPEHVIEASGNNN